MIKQISIKNFAIIDDLVIDFQPGYNVFTGETGAGKSIIIEALGLLIGARADSTMVRHGTNKAIIEGVFELNSAIIAKFELADVVEDDLLIITKELDSNGKSICKINGHITTISNIKKITINILDIHSQQDNQYLLNKAYHLNLIDAFAGQNIAQEKQEYAECYANYITNKQELEELQLIQYNQDLLDLMKYQFEEIENAQIGIDEVEKLEVEQKRIQDYAKISDHINEINEALNGEKGALSSLYIVKKSFESMNNDPLFVKHLAAIDDLYFQLEDFSSSIKNDFAELNYDEYQINKIQERIFLINKLKRKYGNTTQAISTKQEELARHIEKMEHQAQRIVELTTAMASLRQKVLEKGILLDQKRNSCCQQLIVQIKHHLKELFLKNAEFGLIVTPLKEPNGTGISEYEFSASLNPGTPLRPLIKIASGGEMSRLMLGLKIIFNTLYGVSTSIFDEIDVGVSGKVSRAVGLKMYELAASMQVLCITHSPQVASIGHYQYLVEKVIKNNNTYTNVRLLNENERIIEIAKMLSGGSTPTKAAIQNAKELLYT